MNPGEHSAEKRPYPVDTLVLPVRRRKGRSERTRRVHCGPRKRASEQDVHGDREADGEAGDFVECAFGVHRCCEDDEYQEESRYGFQLHAVGDREVRRQRGRAERHGPPHRIRDNELDQIGRCTRAEATGRSNRRWR